MVNESSHSWDKAVISAEDNISTAIESLNVSMMQIVLIVDEQNRLIGTVTDGDIRRGLLNGIELSNSACSIMNRDPFVISTSMDRASVLQLMQINRLHQLPVIDEHRRIVDLYLFDELVTPDNRENTMVIMAGGKGTRLRPYTENCPKPLLEVGGKPMLEHIIHRASLDGFSKFIISIHYLGHMIEDYFGNGEKWNVEISYLREESPLGTAGALSLITDKLSNPLLITNGDVLTDIRYSEIIDFHIDHNAVATMAVRRHQWENPFGVVKTKGVDIIGFEEKPIVYSHINAGIYVLDHKILEMLEVNKYCDMPILFDRIKDHEKRTIVYPMHEPWLDVGRHDDFQSAQKLHSAK